MKVPSFLIAAITLASVSATAAEYDVKCTFAGNEKHGIVFNFGGRYNVTGDTAVFENYKGLAYEPENLYMIEIYEGRKNDLKNDASYKPRGEKWQNHFKFNLESLDGPGLDPNSGGTNYMLISKEPTSVKKNRVDNVPNPGTEYHSVFHAGLEYNESDSATRTEITCKGYQYVSDREVKKKP